MRLSTYEIILPLVGTDEKPIEGYTLLMNGLYGAVDIVPKEDADKLQAGNLAGLPAALRERLMLRGHITRKDEAGELALSLAGPASRFTEAERATIMSTTSQKEMFDIVKAAAFFPEPEEKGK